MTTIEQARAASRLRQTESARRVLRSHSNKIARDAARSNAEPSVAMLIACGKAAIDAERAEMAVLIARTEYFKAHPAA